MPPNQDSSQNSSQNSSQGQDLSALRARFNPDRLREIAIALVLAIVLARLSFGSYASDSVLWPFAVHTFAIGIYFAFFHKATETPPKPFSAWWLVPGAAVWAFAFGWWLFMGRSTAIPLDISMIASITVIPVAEELYFRAGFSELWRRACGPILGSVASAGYFAVLHGDGDIFSANLLTWLPLGPFLLALCCEGLYRKTKQIRVACYFHLSCNLSAVLFYDKVPLDFLSYLYTYIPR